MFLLTGKRLLRQWVCAPLCNPKALRERLDAVEDLMLHADAVSMATETLRALPDLERCLATCVHVTQPRHSHPKSTQDALAHDTLFALCTCAGVARGVVWACREGARVSALGSCGYLGVVLLCPFALTKPVRCVIGLSSCVLYEVRVSLSSQGKALGDSQSISCCQFLTSARKTTARH